MLSLPQRLDKVLDDIGVGVVVMRLADNRRAMIVDYDGATGAPIIVMQKDKHFKSDESPHMPKHYKVDKIECDKLAGWIAMNLGQDEHIIVDDC